MIATISADIISSTALSVDEIIKVKQQLEELFARLEKLYPGFWGRIVKGDSRECIIPDPKYALRIALLIKSFLKSMEIDGNEDKRFFQLYALRTAIGIGTMRLIDREHDMMDGEAIYLSGRKLEEMGSPVKGTLQIATTHAAAQALQTIGVLADAIVNNATLRQSQVIYYKLLGNNEHEIAEILNIKQSGVNQRSTSAQWYAIDTAVDYFEQVSFS